MQHVDELGEDLQRDVTDEIGATDSTADTTAEAGDLVTSGSGATEAEVATGESRAVAALQTSGRYDEPGTVPEWVSETERGVRFFGPEQLKFVLMDNATLGRPGDAIFMMPEQDAVAVNDGLSAAIESGMAPSATAAYHQGLDIFGLSAPLDALTPRTPTHADAGGWPHFLPGGHTVVNIDGHFLVNDTREFVVDGGGAMPSGSIVFQLLPGGLWDILAIFR